MLVACSKCSRQYDVGERTPGSKIRCYCGVIVPVPEPRVRNAPMQRCSSCGGRLREGSRTCDYCGAEVTLGERGWGDACPKCFARLVKGAAFCGACGVRISPHALRRTEGSETCPRCESALSVCEVGDTGFLECTSCGGVWLENSVFREAVEDRERESAIASWFARPTEAAERREAVGGRETEVRYLKCPVCDAIMNRRNFAKASGVIVDRCADHGYWLDAHEMEAILAFVEGGGMDRARKLDLERQKAELELARVRAMETRPSQVAGPGPAARYRMRAAPGGPLSGGMVGLVASFLDTLVD